MALRVIGPRQAPCWVLLPLPLPLPPPSHPPWPPPPPQINKVFLKNGLHTYGKKKCSRTLTIKERQIKTLWERFHFSATRLTKNKKDHNTFCWQGCGETDIWTHLHTSLVGMQIDATLWKELWQYLTKLNMHLRSHPAVPLSWISPEDGTPACEDTDAKVFPWKHYF